ncbi:MAG: hypothetical protein K0R61_19 [Microvirga sp.]|jgi:hypothetical protein|nr:hypothetical protein [Microvirga sp.]MDF2969569.1 hypothetical protein [Microvirga sp.]
MTWTIYRYYPNQPIVTTLTYGGSVAAAQSMGLAWVRDLPVSAACEATLPMRQPPPRPEEFLSLDDRIGLETA